MAPRAKLNHTTIIAFTVLRQTSLANRFLVLSSIAIKVRHYEKE